VSFEKNKVRNIFQNIYFVITIVSIYIINGCKLEKNGGKLIVNIIISLCFWSVCFL